MSAAAFSNDSLAVFKDRLLRERVLGDIESVACIINQ